MHAMLLKFRSGLGRIGRPLARVTYAGASEQPRETASTGEVPMIAAAIHLRNM